MSPSGTLPAHTAILDRIAVLSCENASSALSKWFGKAVRIHSEGFAAASLSNVGTMIDGGETAVAAVHMQMAGALSGGVLLAFPEQSAVRLVSLLMGETMTAVADFGEMGQSALCETGNIVGSAFVNNLATHLGVRATPSAPEFRYDLGAALIEPLVTAQVEQGTRVLYVAATFEIEGAAMDWWLYVVPSPECMQVMAALLN